MAGVPVPNSFVSADDVSLGKPNPEPYLTGARYLGVEPENYVVFEDASSWIRAAHAVRIKVLAVPTTYAAGELGEADGLLRNPSQVRVAAVVKDGAGYLNLTW